MKKTIRTLSLAAAALAATIALAPAARAFSLDACEKSPDTPEIRALVQASHDVGTKDFDKVRAAVAEVRQKAKDDAFLLLWSGSLLKAIGDGGADAIFDEAVVAAKAIPAKEGQEAAPIATLYEATALVRKGKVDEGRALLATVEAQPDAHKKYACRFFPAAQALADAGRANDALALLTSVQKAAPGARSVADARVEIALHTKDERAIDEAFAAALSAFPNDVEITVRKANQVKIKAGRDAALALLDPLLLAGETSPSMLGEYLGLLSADPSEQKLARYQKLAAEHPGLPALEMMVGVIHHYLHHYEESTRHMERAGDLIDKEPRVAMYMAMNAFHTPGQEAKAEVLIDRAARAGRPDPDIYYCRAVIEVRKDPAAAVRDLERYLALTETRADVAPEKQQRVKQTLDLLAACVRTPDPRACVQRDVVEQAKALAFAEHFGKAQNTHAPGPQAPSTPGHGTGSLHEDGGREQVIAALAAVLVLGLAYAAVTRDAKRS